LGDGEIFAGLLPEVVATGAVICDKVLMRGQNRVARHILLRLLKAWWLCL
jgi:hypothetical protein